MSGSVCERHANTSNWAVQDPKPHVSIAWLLGNQRDRLEAALVSLGADCALDTSGGGAIKHAVRFLRLSSIPQKQAWGKCRMWCSDGNLVHMRFVLRALFVASASSLAHLAPFPAVQALSASAPPGFFLASGNLKKPLDDPNLARDVQKGPNKSELLICKSPSAKFGHEQKQGLQHIVRPGFFPTAKHHPMSLLHSSSLCFPSSPIPSAAPRWALPRPAFP